MNRMKIKTILGILISVVLVAALVLIFTSSSKETAVPAENQTNLNQTQTENSTPRSGVGLLGSLAASTEPIECAISYRANTEVEEIEGTFFSRAGKVRADFLQEDETLGQILTSYVIREDTLYLWSEIEGESYGVKTTANSEASADVPLPVPEDESVRYVCTDWVAIDDSIFEIPTDILFQDAAEVEIEYGTVYEEGEFPL